MAFLLDDLGSQVLGSAAYWESIVVALNIVFGESEIGEFDVAVESNQYIFWFEAEFKCKYSR